MVERHELWRSKHAASCDGKDHKIRALANVAQLELN